MHIFFAVLTLLVPLALHAATITSQETTEQIVSRVVVADCLWTEVIEQVTTTHYEEWVPYVSPTITYSDTGLTEQYEEGPGYLYEFGQNCEQYERQSLETYNTRCPGSGIGTPEGNVFTGEFIDYSGGVWKRWDEIYTTEYTRLDNFCSYRNCRSAAHNALPIPFRVTPEPSTFVFICLGILVLWHRRKMR